MQDKTLRLKGDIEDLAEVILLKYLTLLCFL